MKVDPSLLSVLFAVGEFSNVHVLVRINDLESLSVWQILVKQSLVNDCRGICAAVRIFALALSEALYEISLVRIAVAMLDTTKSMRDTCLPKSFVFDDAFLVVSFGICHRTNTFGDAIFDNSAIHAVSAVSVGQLLRR